MSLLIKTLICIGVGYFIGAINPSYLIAKAKGFDIRKRGSGNAGASNALIVFGKAMGIFCALFDIYKACLAIELTRRVILPGFSHAFIITGTAAIVGHMYPWYMKLKGGKGLACLGGVVLMYDWKFFLALLAIEIVIVLATDYICFVPMTASIIFPIAYGILEKDFKGASIFLIATILILFKHAENIVRIRSKTELHFSYLWNKDKEKQRMNENGVDIDVTRDNVVTNTKASNNESNSTKENNNDTSK